MMRSEHTVQTPTSSPVAAPPATARHSPRFYLVGEAERSTRRRPVIAQGYTNILVNGRWHELRGRTTTFEQLLRIAFPGKTLPNPQTVTMTYRHGSANAYDGMLTPGDAIPLTEGLTVNANATYAS